MATDQKNLPRRLNLDLGPKARENLERISVESEQSLSEVVRNALAVYGVLWSELTAKKGRSLIIRDPDGQNDMELIIPGLRT